MGHNGRSGVQCLSGSPFGIHRHGWRSDRCRGTAYSEPAPYGMVFVKKGSLKIGTEETDSLWGMTIPTREISVDGFWMDANEVSNAKYRQFVFFGCATYYPRTPGRSGIRRRRDLQDRGGQVRESCDSLSELEKSRYPGNARTKMS